MTTPGHTPGHVSIKITSGSCEAMITGDALHSTAPYWHFKFDADAEVTVNSRKQLLERASEATCIVLGNHFTPPSIGRVTYRGNAFRWIE